MLNKLIMPQFSGNCWGVEPEMGTDLTIGLTGIRSVFALGRWGIGLALANRANATYPYGDPLRLDGIHFDRIVVIIVIIVKFTFDRRQGAFGNEFDRPIFFEPVEDGFFEQLFS